MTKLVLFLHSKVVALEQILVSVSYFQDIIISYNHRTPEWFGMKRTLNII